MEKNNQLLLVWVLVALVYYCLLPSNSIYLMPILRIALIVLLNILYICNNFRRIIKIKWPVLIFLIGFIFCNFITLITNNQFLKNDYQYIIEINIIYIFCCLPLKTREHVFSLFVKIGAVYLTIALCEFILYNYLNIGFIIRGHIDRGEGSNQFYSHGIFNIFSEGELILRFQALFREPGYLGVTSALILFAKNNCSPYCKIIWLLAGLMSLSLAFYIFLCVAIIYYVFITKQFSNPWLLMSSILFIVIISIFAYEILNDAIIQRIIDYSQNGDNRTSLDLNTQLEKMFTNNQYLFGYGNNRFEREFGFGNAGIKAELYKYGIINILLFILFFEILIQSTPYTLKEKIIVSFLFLMCFYNGDCKYSSSVYIILLSIYLPQYESSSCSNTNNRQLNTSIV